MTMSPSSSSGTSSSMTASVAGPACTMIMMLRGCCSAATNSSTVRVGMNSPSSPCAAIRASVRAWVRLCRTTWWPCRAKFRARLAPMTARPVTPICELMPASFRTCRHTDTASVAARHRTTNRPTIPARRRRPRARRPRARRPRAPGTGRRARGSRGGCTRPLPPSGPGGPAQRATRGPEPAGSVVAENSAQAEVAAELGDVAGGLDVVGGPLDAPLVVDDEGRADDADDLLAVHLLRPVGAVGPEHLLLRVGDQRDAEVLLLPEADQLLRRVRRDPDDVQPGLGEITGGGGEVDGLGGAARRQRGGVAVDDHAPAPVRRQRDWVAVGVRQGEVRRRVAR